MKAVITTGGNQFLVAKGDQIEVELLGDDKKTVDFEPLALVDGAKTTVGSPTVGGAKVKAKVLDADKKADKVKVRKFQAKKRVSKQSGHRQRHTILEITDISSK